PSICAELVVLMPATRFCANVRAARQPINPIETKTGEVRRLAKPEVTFFFMEVLLYVVNCRVIKQRSGARRVARRKPPEKHSLYPIVFNAMKWARKGDAVPFHSASVRLEI